MINYLAVGQVYTSIKSLVPSEELVEIEEAVDKYWKWETDDDPKQAVIDLEKFTRKYPNNWLAPYWASYISTQISNSIQGEEAFYKKAQTFYGQANDRFKNKEDNILCSCLPALQSLIYQLQSFRAQEGVGDSLSRKALESLNEAYNLSLNNPFYGFNSYVSISRYGQQHRE